MADFGDRRDVRVGLPRQAPHQIGSGEQADAGGDESPRRLAVVPFDAGDEGLVDFHVHLHPAEIGDAEEFLTFFHLGADGDEAFVGAAESVACVLVVHDHPRLRGDDLASMQLLFDLPEFVEFLEEHRARRFDFRFHLDQFRPRLQDRLFEPGFGHVDFAAEVGEFAHAREVFEGVFLGGELAQGVVGAVEFGAFHLRLARRQVSQLHGAIGPRTAVAVSFEIRLREFEPAGDIVVLHPVLAPLDQCERSSDQGSEGIEDGILADAEELLKIELGDLQRGEFRSLVGVVDLQLDGELFLGLHPRRVRFGNDDPLGLLLILQARIVQVHQTQLLHYLKSTRIEVGMLLNFGERPEFKRMIFTNDAKDSRG